MYVCMYVYVHVYIHAARKNYVDIGFPIDVMYFIPLKTNSLARARKPTPSKALEMLHLNLIRRYPNDDGCVISSNGRARGFLSVEWSN
jgi:hypothetical protein